MMTIYAPFTNISSLYQAKPQPTYNKPFTPTQSQDQLSLQTSPSMRFGQGQALELREGRPVDGLRMDTLVSTSAHPRTIRELLAVIGPNKPLLIGRYDNWKDVIAEADWSDLLGDLPRQFKDGRLVFLNNSFTTLTGRPGEFLDILPDGGDVLPSRVHGYFELKDNGTLKYTDGVGNIGGAIRTGDNVNREAGESDHQAQVGSAGGTRHMPRGGYTWQNIKGRTVQLNDGDKLQFPGGNEMTIR